MLNLPSITWNNYSPCTKTDLHSFGIQISMATSNCSLFENYWEKVLFRPGKYIETGAAVASFCVIIWRMLWKIKKIIPFMNSVFGNKKSIP